MTVYYEQGRVNRMPYNKYVLGETIRELRREKGISQEVLSGLSGIARSHLSMIENGTTSINVETLWKIADAIGVPLSEIVERVEMKMEQ